MYIVYQMQKSAHPNHTFIMNDRKICEKHTYSLYIPLINAATSETRFGQMVLRFIMLFILLTPIQASDFLAFDLEFPTALNEIEYFQGSLFLMWVFN